MAKIGIDPGHNGYNSKYSDVGAVGYSGHHECDVTLAVAFKVKEKLEYNGHEVIMTRTGNEALGTNMSTDLNARCAFLNKAGVDIGASIHCNSASSSSAHGTETYCYAYGGEGEKIARAIQTRLNNEIGLTARGSDNGVKSADFCMVRETNMPFILTEMAFISNEKEEAMLIDDSWQDKFADAIAAGFCDYLGQEYKKQSSSPYDSLVLETCTAELKQLGIITNDQHWNEKAYADDAIAWFIKKAYLYIVTNGGSIKNPTEFDWYQVRQNLKGKGIISDTDLWNEKAYCDEEVKWLLVKTNDYI